MNQIVTIIFCMILGCHVCLSYMTVDVILDQIEDGPLKDKIQQPHKMWFFKTDEEKSAEYIMDILRRSGSEEIDQPLTTFNGYWGEIFEMIGLASNRRMMKNAISQLLINQPDEIKEQEFDKISIAQQKIRKLWRRT